jgi:DNA-binding NarL/FixJ family response regulator
VKRVVTPPVRITKHRVFLVDDHPIVRQGLTLLINQEPDLMVCGEAQEARGLRAALVAAQPDIVLLDISLTGPDGLDVLKMLREEGQQVPILVLSMHDEAVYAERVLRAGANGYIMKQEATERVLIAVRRILQGQVYVSDRMASRMLLQLVSKQVPDESAAIARLSDRELEVFRLIGAGRGTREIAQTLNLSVKTVESYQAHIKEKLALRSARALMQRAIEWRLSEHEA